MECCIGDNDSVASSDENPCEIKSNRKGTDEAFLVIAILSLIALFVFLGVCFAHADLDRLINGYDDCGNICGVNNNMETESLKYQCYGKNMENKKYLFYKVSNDYYSRHNYFIKECVGSCNDAEYPFSNRCFDSALGISVEGTSTLYKIIQSTWKEIILMSFFAILFSFAIMLMYRHKTSLIIPIILFGFLVLCVGVTIYCWVRMGRSNKLKNLPEYNTFLLSSTISTVVTSILIIVVIAMTKRLPIIIPIFKESAKAIADMPSLLLLPLLTFLIILVFLICGTYTTLLLESSGYLEKLSYLEIDQLNRKLGSLEYKTSKVGTFSMFYNWFIILWIIQFVIGCQQIIIGGSVATWFFTRNKYELESPIIKSTYYLFRYHLGTACLGSLIITIVGIIKAIVRSSKNMLNNKDSLIVCLLYCLLKYILEFLELFLKFFSRNAYIQTAIHGYSFCKGGKRAFHLLVKNIYAVIAINCIGDYILFITKCFVAVVTVLISILILWAEENTEYIVGTVMIIGCISFWIAHSFATIYEMTIDTIFLCFCEDCEVNDGITRPFFMSRKLMEAVALSNEKKLNSNIDLRFADTTNPKH